MTTVTILIYIIILPSLLIIPGIIIVAWPTRAWFTED